MSTGSGTHSFDEKTSREQSIEVVVKVEDEIDKLTERRIVRKVDTWLLPLVTFLFLMNFIDRSAIGKSSRISVL
jgi:hypothetical protein